MNATTGAILAIGALVIGLFIGIGFGKLIFGGRSQNIDTSALDNELATNKALLADYRAQLEDERAKSEGAVKLSAELDAMKTRVEELSRLSADADRRRVGA